MPQSQGTQEFPLNILTSETFPTGPGNHALVLTAFPVSPWPWRFWRILERE